MCCRCCSKTQKQIWVFGLGSLFVVIGLILGILWPTLSTRILHDQLVLKEGSMNYENWIETPIPMYFDVYLFNWDNPQDLAQDNYKPHFSEYGPLVFTEKHKRVDIEWNSNHTVSFYQTREWVFQPHLSNGTLDHPITHANVITATVAHLLGANKLTRKVANFLIDKQGGSLLWTKPAGQWIFEGFDDKLLSFLKLFNSPKIDIPFDKFGWLVERNMSKTYDGRFQMNTGTDKIEKLGYLTQWNYSNKTKYYTDNCAMVNGTTGELWPPSIDTTKFVSVFANDICRSIDIYPSGEYTNFGVTGTIWKATNKTLDNGEICKDKVCFCPNGDEKLCPKNGAVDVSKCRWNAPVSFSFPHFYLADPSYVNNVSGIKPDKNKHEFFMALEPTAGIPISVNAKFQINMKLQKLDNINVYNNVRKDVVMPMFWFNQRAQLDDATASKAKLALSLPIIGIATGYSLAGVGVIIILIGVILTILNKWGGSPQDDRQPLSNDYGRQ